MKATVYTMHFAGQFQGLSQYQRRLIKRLIDDYAKTGKAPGLVDLGDHRRFTAEDITVHFEEDAETITVTTLHRFPTH